MAKGNQSLEAALQAISNALPTVWMENNLYHPLGYRQKLKLREFQYEMVNDIYNDDYKKYSYSVGRQNGKSVIVAAIAIHRAYVLGRNVLIVTPAENHLQNIWEKIEALMRWNDELKSHLGSERQKPFRLKEFKGSGKIKGLISGSGKDASVTIRSFGGDDIFLDEAAFISPAAYYIMKPFLINAEKDGRADYKWVMTGTPSPFEDYFYDSHHTLEDYYHKIYSTPNVHPNWTDEMDRMMKESMTPEQYQREVMGQFPKVSGGIFSPTNINTAMRDYKYNLKDFKKGYRYILSVDWNTAENGAQLSVLGFSNEMIYVKYREIIANVENPQTTAVNRIIEINKTCPIQYIFVDEGYGATQIELLHQHGTQHPESRIREKLVPLDFNSSKCIQVKIGNNDPESRPAKYFMVGLMQKIVQDRKFQFSKYDNHKKTGLYKQFRDFRKKKKSFGRYPVYEDGYFHGLMSVMMGVLGMYKLFSRYSVDRINSPLGQFVPFDSIKSQKVFVDDESSVPNPKPIPTLAEMREHDPNWVAFNHWEGEDERKPRANPYQNGTSHRAPSRIKRRSF